MGLDLSPRANRLLLPFRLNRSDWSHRPCPLTHIGIVPVNSGHAGHYSTNARFTAGNYLSFGPVLTNHFYLWPSNGWEIEVRVYFESGQLNDGGSSHIIAKHGVGGDESWELSVETSGRVVFRFTRDNGNWITAFSAFGAIVEETWYHIKISRTQVGPTRMFIDGTIATTQTSNYEVRQPPSDTPLLIGSGLRGRLEDFRFRIRTMHSSWNDTFTPVSDNFTPPTAMAGVLAGTVSDANANLAARSWRLYHRVNGAVFASGSTNSVTGEFNIACPRMPLDLHFVKKPEEGDMDDIFLPARTPVLEI